MKILNNKNIFLLLIWIVVAATTATAYYTYDAYQKYNSINSNTKSIKFIQTIDEILRSIDKERLISAMYMGNKDNTDFTNVLNARGVVDSKIDGLNSFIQAHQKFSSYQKRIEFILENLKYVRTGVDSLSMDYRNIFFDTYQQKIIMSLLGIMRMSASNSSTEEIKQYMLTFTDLSKLKANSDLEKSFIAFMLNGSKKMADKDLLVWDNTINSDVLPQFNTLKNKEIVEKLNKNLSKDSFHKIILDERIQILSDIHSGNYTLEIENWIKSFDPRSKHFKTSQNILINVIEKYKKGNIVERKKVLTEYLVALLSFLLLLLALLLLYHNMSRDKRLFDDTLKDIETVLSKEQQKKLKSLIKKRELTEIYHFLTETIEESNLAKDLFLANMSHEIRTPLNGIVGFTQLLRSTNTSAEQEEFIGVIEQSSNNLLNIVNDILDFSKIKAEKIELEHTPFDPIEVFESAIESYGARAAEKDIELGVYIDPLLPAKLVGDPTKISQILINLMSNALKFTNMTGNIDVSIEKISNTRENTTVLFSVSDTGIGITEEQQKIIFEAFSQADVSTNRKFGGTGLGLAISTQLVSLMGGKLDIRSEKDKGTTFFFTVDIDNTEQNLQRDLPNWHHVNVGYFVPDKTIERAYSESLEKYVTATGASYTVYDGDELLSMDENALPDILFINHRYCKRGNELEEYVNLKTKIVVVTTGDIKNRVVDIEEQIDKIFYKPINLTKTLKSLDVIEQTNTEPIVKKVNKEDEKFENLHALVAEDNSINQKLIRGVLENLGLTVTLADNGEEALELRKENEYDMIFMDIQMPVMGGVEATEKILEYEAENDKKHLPIIALTANALKGDREKYIEAGMDNYASKPLNIEILKKIIFEYFPYKTVEEENKTEETKEQTIDVSKEEEPTDIKVSKVEEDIVDDILPKVPFVETISAEIDAEEDTEYSNKDADVITSDILLYKQEVLAVDIYLSIFSNIGYTVDVADNEDDFMDKLESSNYNYALFDEEAFANVQGLVIDLIKDGGITPFIFTLNTDKSRECCDILSMEANVEEIKKKFNKKS